MSVGNIVTPNHRVIKGWGCRDTNLGTDTYKMDKLWSPDTGIAQSCVLDLGSPDKNPNKTTWFDHSGKNNHGTITGATPIQLPSGEWVMSFDGVDDGINCGTNSILDFGVNTSFRIHAWIYPKVLNAVNTILGRRGAGATRWWVSVNNTGVLYFETKDTVASIDSVLTSAGRIIVNTWQCIDLIHNAGGECTLYINGILVGYKILTNGEFLNTTDSLTIGAYSLAPYVSVFSGYLSDVNLNVGIFSINQVNNDYLSTKWRYQ